VSLDTRSSPLNGNALQPAEMEESLDLNVTMGAREDVSRTAQGAVNSTHVKEATRLLPPCASSSSFQNLFQSLKQSVQRLQLYNSFSLSQPYLDLEHNSSSHQEPIRLSEFPLSSEQLTTPILKPFSEVNSHSLIMTLFLQTFSQASSQ
jgi:hypothetical protein